MLLHLFGYLIFTVYCGTFCMSATSTRYCPRGRASNDCPSEIPIFASSLKSTRTLIPYGYERFDFCPSDPYPKPAVKRGQSIFGEKHEVLPGPFKLEFLTTVMCQTVCKKEYVAGEDTDAALDFIKKGIALNYQHYWVLDTVPMVGCYNNKEDREICTNGFPVGDYGKIEDGKDECAMGKGLCDKETFYLFNHLDITVTYSLSEQEEGIKRENRLDSGRVISAKVEPKSNNNKDNRRFRTCMVDNGFLQLRQDPVEKNLSFWYTYTVKWVEYNNTKKMISEVDLDYARTTGIETSQYYIRRGIGIWVNTVLAFLVLSGLFALNVFSLGDKYKRSTLCLYLSKIDDFLGIHEISDLQLLKGDIFRPPKHSMLLAVFIGNGIQIFCTTILSLAFVFLGRSISNDFSLVLDSRENNNGSIMTVVLVSYACMGPVAGYYSGRIYKILGGKNFVSITFATSILCPGLLFVVYLLINTLLWIEGSSDAAKFSSVIILPLLWFGTAVPLTFLACYVGFKRCFAEDRFRSNRVSRDIPVKHWILKHLHVGMGSFAFMIGFIPQHNILVSLLFDLKYTQFLTLLADFPLLMLICIMASIVVCSTFLSVGDYRWWWHAFLTGGCWSLHSLVFCTYFLLTRMQLVGWISIMLYFGYTFMVIFPCFLLTGTAGFLGSFGYICRIYK